MSCMGFKDPGAAKPTQVTKKEKIYSRLLWQNGFLLCKANLPYQRREAKRNGLASYWVHETKAVWMGPSRLLSNYLPFLGKLISFDWMGYYYHYWSIFSFLSCSLSRKRHKLRQDQLSFLSISPSNSVHICFIEEKESFSTCDMKLAQ